MSKYVVRANNFMIFNKINNGIMFGPRREQASKHDILLGQIRNNLTNGHWSRSQVYWDYWTKYIVGSIWNDCGREFTGFAHFSIWRWLDPIIIETLAISLSLSRHKVIQLLSPKNSSPYILRIWYNLSVIPGP